MTQASNECDRNLGFLICDVARLVRRSFNSRAKSTGLTQAQWQAMFVISRNPGIGQASLADELEIHPITLTQQVDRMQASGWVERRRNPNDRRATCLFITQKGRAVLDRLREIGCSVLSFGFADIDPKLRETIVDALSRVRTRFVSAEAAKTPVASKRSGAVRPRRPAGRKSGRGTTSKRRVA
ncbi:MAG: MarR family winged helix-turn-helix transcriptional regulator [Gemmatimonas sp.]